MRKMRLTALAAVVAVGVVVSLPTSALADGTDTGVQTCTGGKIPTLNARANGQFSTKGPGDSSYTYHGDFGSTYVVRQNTGVGGTWWAVAVGTNRDVDGPGTYGFCKSAPPPRVAL